MTTDELCRKAREKLANEQNSQHDLERQLAKLQTDIARSVAAQSVLHDVIDWATTLKQP